MILRQTRSDPDFGRKLFFLKYYLRQKPYGYSMTLSTKNSFFGQILWGSAFESTISYFIVQSSTLQYNIVLQSTEQYLIVQYRSLQYRVVPYSTISYFILQSSTLQYNIVLYTTEQYRLKLWLNHWFWHGFAMAFVGFLDFKNLFCGLHGHPWFNHGLNHDFAWFHHGKTHQINDVSNRG